MTWWLSVWVTLCAYNGSMRCMLPWELRCVLGGNRSESGIILLYSASEQGYLVLALYKHALLLYIFTTSEEDLRSDNWYTISSNCVSMAWNSGAHGHRFSVPMFKSHISYVWKVFHPSSLHLKCVRSIQPFVRKGYHNTQTHTHTHTHRHTERAIKDANGYEELSIVLTISMTKAGDNIIILSSRLHTPKVILFL